jgi:hypothetical protein
MISQHAGVKILSHLSLCFQHFATISPELPQASVAPLERLGDESDGCHEYAQNWVRRLVAALRVGVAQRLEKDVRERQVVRKQILRNTPLDLEEARDLAVVRRARHRGPPLEGHPLGLCHPEILQQQFIALRQLLWKVGAFDLVQRLSEQ